MTSNRRKGAALVFVVGVLFAIVILTGLTIDTCYTCLVGQQLQAAADASALAGAQKVRVDQTIARQWAMNVALKNHAAGSPVQLTTNGANSPDGEIVFGTFNRLTGVFTPNTTSPDAVKVTANRTASALGGPLPLLFGPIVGVSSANVSRQAIAMVGGDIFAGVIILDPTAPGALTFKGTAQLSVNGGATIVNSSDPQAVSYNGSSLINVPDLYLVSGETIPGGNFIGTRHQLTQPAADPLANLPAPDINSMPIRRYPAGTSNIEPGYYPKGLPDKANLILSPGVYAINGTVSQNLTGTGVMLYLVDSTMDYQGGGTMTITPPTSGVYAGLSVFQARGNKTSCTCYGNSQSILGTIYMPSANLEMRGTADNFSTQLIANTMVLRGNVTVNIDYNGAFPSPGNNVFLVK